MNFSGVMWFCLQRTLSEMLGGDKPAGGCVCSGVWSCECPLPHRKGWVGCGRRWGPRQHHGGPLMYASAAGAGGLRDPVCR